MTSARIDLHAHTNHSDGTCSPTQLVELAAEVGLRALAVTDHDTMSAIPEAREVGARLGVEILNGCEVTTRLPTGIVHVLVYGVDLDHEPFGAFLDGIREGRHNRNLQILEKLQGLGLELTYEDISKYAVGNIIARPHFARALVDAGIVEDLREAFDRFLSDKGPAYVPAEVPAPIDAVRAAKAAGGVSVIAHPRQMKLGSMGAYRRKFRRWKEAGLGGIEVQHASADATHRTQYAAIAEELDLVPSGGSDFHGDNKPHIRLGHGDGSIHVEYATWEALRARMSA